VSFGVAATAVVALLASLFVIHLPSDKAWQRVCLDASHGPIFAAVAVVLGMWLASRVRGRDPAPWPDWARCGQAFALAVLIGIVVEFLQSLQGRPPSLFDVLTDAAGAAAGLAAWSLFARPRTGRLGVRDRSDEWAVSAIALAGLAFIVWRPVHAAVAYAGRAASFPVIAQFEGPRDLYFVTTVGKAAEIVSLPAPWAQREGERALRLTYDAEHAPAVQVVEPSPDWRGYSVIAADLTNAADTELRLTFRIHDATHDWSHEDRLNLPLVIAPRTRTTVRVALSAIEAAPASRPMDLSRIANVMLFGQEGQAPGELYVSRLWLE
jgi:hypothetical protein